VDNGFIAMDRATSSDDNENTAGIVVGVTIAVIVVELLHYYSSTSKYER